MTPSYENLKIYGDEVICSLISLNQISSFGFLFNSNENLTLSKDFKITINDVEYIRKCQLIKNSNTELYLKFKKISLDLDESFICQPFIRAESFTCLSCNHNFSKDNSSSCCSFKNNIIKINKGSIYKLSLLNYKTYLKNISKSRDEFKLLHFASVVDTMLLGDPI
jgi:hypothetical protein